MHSLARYGLLMSVLVLFTNPAHAFVLTCLSKDLSVEDGGGVEGVSAHFKPIETPKLEGDEIGIEFFCKDENGDTVDLNLRANAELGLEFGLGSVGGAVVSCPTVSKRQLKKHFNRVVRTLGFSGGLLVEGGASAGFDSRGNPCAISLVDVGGMGIRFGFQSFNLEYKPNSH